MSICAIFWDNDGVLVNTEHLFFEANRVVLADKAFELTPELFAEISLRQGRSVLDLLLSRGASKEEIEYMRSLRDMKYDALLSDGIEVLPGIRSTLHLLHKQMKMGIVTSSQLCHFETIHRQTDLLPLFDFILTGEDYGPHKPDPAPYLKAVEISGDSPENCVAIEDSERGLRSAIAAGIRCIVVRHQMAANLDFNGAAAIVDTADEIIPLLTAWSSSAPPP